MITLLIFFFFKNFKYLWRLIVSGDVRLFLIILSLYFMPKVPIVAAGNLFILKIWWKISATEVFPFVPVTAIIFFGFNL